MSKASVQKSIDESPVVIFSKSYCPYCIRVKKLFSDLKVSAKVIELDQMKEGSDIQSILEDMTGQTTVPSVFIGKKHIGGCDDTTRLHSQGKLVPLLKTASAL
eukprot:TRINITY_DN17965_c0_g1_i1.p1 TRINITY_DN17965_c0_g1~~TRINITY_DN17965_c0_g1_i1.p1  ORF type:complete len:103 (-),score=15.70 TRINITY_DN17965_c0_g1_i1:53-361(-)